MFKFTQIALCRETICDNMDYNNPNSIKRSLNGDLQVMLETTTGMLLFKMKDFQYGINPNDQVIYDDQHPSFKLMLCLDANPQNTWVLKINDKADLVYYFLNERCKLIHTRASRMILQNIKNEMKTVPQYPVLEEPQRLQYHQFNPEIQKSTESGLLEASKTFGKGLALAGIFLSKGLQYIGSFLSKRVSPSDNINLAPGTKAIIDKSVSASKNLLQFGTEKFANIFRIAVKQAIKLQKTIEKTQTGKKLKENGAIDSAKDNLRIGLQAITNIYDGYSIGYEQATNGLSKSANQVISAKYGNDAGDASLKLFQGYKNINKIPNIINEALKVTLKQTVKQHARKA